MENKADHARRARMTTNFEIKSIGADGTFEGYASVFDVVDSQRDVVRAGAFRSSLKQGARKVQLLWQHQWESPIGTIEVLFENKRGLYVRGRLLLEVAQAREAYALLKAGVVRGLSIGYSVTVVKSLHSDEMASLLSALERAGIALLYATGSPGFGTSTRPV